MGKRDGNWDEGKGKQGKGGKKGKGKGKGKQGKRKERDMKWERSGLENQVEKWEVGEGNQVIGNFILP